VIEVSLYLLKALGNVIVAQLYTVYYNLAMYKGNFTTGQPVFISLIAYVNLLIWKQQKILTYKLPLWYIHKKLHRKNHLEL
jgi:hypothetical protein